MIQTMAFYPRLILPQLEKELETQEITVITGMRKEGWRLITAQLWRETII